MKLFSISYLEVLCASLRSLQWQVLEHNEGEYFFDNLHFWQLYFYKQKVNATDMTSACDDLIFNSTMIGHFKLKK